MIHTSPTTLWALREPLILPVVQFLSFRCLPFLLRFLPLLFVVLSSAQNTRAGSTVARLTRSRFDPIALVIGQVSNSLGERQQHLALDGPLLGPGAACPAAGLPGTRDEAGEEQVWWLITHIKTICCYLCKQAWKSFWFDSDSFTAKFINSISIYKIQPCCG